MSFGDCLFFFFFEVYIIQEKIMKQFWFLIIGLIIGFLACYFFNRKDSCNLTDMETIRIDTIKITDSLERPVPYPVVVIRSIAPPDVDTAKVITDYFLKRVYKDTLINTDLLMVSVTDTVTENALLARKINYTYSYPQITKSAKNRLYLNADSRGVISASGTHKNLMISAGYDPVNKLPVLGFGIKLFER